MKNLVCKIVGRIPARHAFDSATLFYEVYDGGKVVAEGASSSEEWLIHDAGGYHTKTKFNELYPDGWRVEFDFSTSPAAPEANIPDYSSSRGIRASARKAVAAMDCVQHGANIAAVEDALNAERNRCISIAQSIEPHNEAEAHLIETIVRKMRGDE